MNLLEKPEKPDDYEKVTLNGIQSDTGRRFNLKFKVKKRKLTHEECSKNFKLDQLNTSCIVSYLHKYSEHEKTSIESNGLSSDPFFNCAYLRGYDNKEKELIGHNNYGEFLP